MRLWTTRLERGLRLGLGVSYFGGLSCLPQDDLSSYSRAWSSVPEQVPVNAAGASSDAGSEPPTNSMTEPPGPAPGDIETPGGPLDAGADAAAADAAAGDAGLDAGADAALDVADAAALPSSATPLPDAGRSDASVITTLLVAAPAAN